MFIAICYVVSFTTLAAMLLLFARIAYLSWTGKYWP